MSVMLRQGSGVWLSIELFNALQKPQDERRFFDKGLELEAQLSFPNPSAKPSQAGRRVAAAASSLAPLLGNKTSKVTPGFVTDSEGLSTAVPRRRKRCHPSVSHYSILYAISVE